MINTGLPFTLGSNYYPWVKHGESQQASRDAGKYERVSLEDVEAGKGPDIKPE
jgi:GDP-fucose transporter C1